MIDFELILYNAGTLKLAPDPTERLMERKGQSQELRKKESVLCKRCSCTLHVLCCYS